jgi:glycosyltransferase involved in cell wall biosynthesis
VKNINILFVAPSETCQGGISAVVSNYKHSSFWSRYNCFLYVTSIESNMRLYSLTYQVLRLIWFLPFILINRPAVISVHTASRNSFYRSFLYILLAKIAKIPVVLHIHPAFFYDFYQQGGSVRKYLIHTAGKFSDKIVFLAPIIRDKFLSIFNNEKLLVIPNSVDVSAYQDLRTDSERKYQLLFMGWIVKEKGVYDIVDVIPDVAAHFPDVQFVFAGNKEVELLQKKINKRGLNSLARVDGWGSGQKKIDLFLNSYCLLLPSYTEGIPNVILEAMASGLPVVTTPVGGIPSVVQEGVTGLFVTPGNKTELKNAILKLLKDDQLWEKMSKEALNQAYESFDIEVIGSKLENLYKNY